ncbi:hypothetical protein OROMI_014945 [Orobanche minor]
MVVFEALIYRVLCLSKYLIKKMDSSKCRLRLVVILEYCLTHPNIKELFSGENILGLKDSNRPFPANQDGVSLLIWRMQSADESLVPLTIYCWPSVSEVPRVQQIDEIGGYDSRKSVLECSIILIDNDNCRLSTFCNPPKFSQRTLLSSKNYQVV